MISINLIFTGLRIAITYKKLKCKEISLYLFIFKELSLLVYFFQGN